MDLLREAWASNKALVITAVIAIAAILYYIWKQNNGGKAGGNSPNAETPSVATEQYKDILGRLGELTPVTNTLQPIVTNNTTTTTTINNPPPVSASLTVATPAVVDGIGNDTARDKAIEAAKRKYSGPHEAAQLQQAIAAIQKQYPRSGPTQ